MANKNYFKGVRLERIVRVSEKLGLKPPAYSTNGSKSKNSTIKANTKRLKSISSRIS